MHDLKLIQDSARIMAYDHNKYNWKKSLIIRCNVAGVTTPSIGVAWALGLWQWIEHENTMDDVVDIFIWDQGMILENSHGCNQYMTKRLYNE